MKLYYPETPARSMDDPLPKQTFNLSLQFPRIHHTASFRDSVCSIIIGVVFSRTPHIVVRGLNRFVSRL